MSKKRSQVQVPEVTNPHPESEPTMTAPETPMTAPETPVTETPVIPQPAAPLAVKKLTNRSIALLTIGGRTLKATDIALCTCPTTMVVAALGDEKRAAQALGNLIYQGLVAQSEDKSTTSLTPAGFAAYNLTFDAQTPKERVVREHKAGGLKRGVASAKYTFAADAKIVTLVANPKRVGSLAHTRFEFYKVGQTRDEAIAALMAGDSTCDRGKAATDFTFNLEHGFLAMDGQVENKPVVAQEGEAAPVAEGEAAPVSETAPVAE